MALTTVVPYTVATLSSVEAARVGHGSPDGTAEPEARRAICPDRPGSSTHGS
jgi:hypothetical protein